jgi:hypothetical protein
MTVGPTYTAREKMQEAQREVSYREWVYKKRVASDAMSQSDADRQIAIMREIATDYGALAATEEERRQPTLKLATPSTTHDWDVMRLVDPDDHGPASDF